MSAWNIFFLHATVYINQNRSGGSGVSWVTQTLHRTETMILWSFSLFSRQLNVSTLIIRISTFLRLVFLTGCWQCFYLSFQSGCVPPPSSVHFLFISSVTCTNPCPISSVEQCVLIFYLDFLKCSTFPPPKKGVLLYHFVSKCYFLLCKVNLSTAVCERFEWPLCYYLEKEVGERGKSISSLCK